MGKMKAKDLMPGMEILVPSNGKVKIDQIRYIGGDNGHWEIESEPTNGCAITFIVHDDEKEFIVWKGVEK